MYEHAPNDKNSRNINAWWVLNSKKLWNNTRFRTRDEQMNVAENMIDASNEKIQSACQTRLLADIKSDLNGVWSLLDSANYQLNTIVFYCRIVALMIGGFLVWNIYTSF
jgi:capsule polysaccharide export protein KpsE/RkpR